VRFIMSMLRLSGVEMCFWEGDRWVGYGTLDVLESGVISIASVFFRVIAYYLNTSRFAITHDSISVTGTVTTLLRECGTNFGQKFVYINLGGASSSHS
jgi:hypothetical protein